MKRRVGRTRRMLTSKLYETYMIYADKLLRWARALPSGCYSGGLARRSTPGREHSYPKLGHSERSR